MNLIPVNRKTGMAAAEGDPNTIIEAFKPGTGPADSFSVIGMDSTMAPEEILKTSPQANQAVSPAPAACSNAIPRPVAAACRSLHPRPASLFTGTAQDRTQRSRTMRAEIENVVDEIKQAISLLRRHL